MTNFVRSACQPWNEERKVRHCLVVLTCFAQVAFNLLNPSTLTELKLILAQCVDQRMQNCKL